MKGGARLQRRRGGVGSRGCKGQRAAREGLQECWERGCKGESRLPKWVLREKVSRMQGGLQEEQKFPKQTCCKEEVLRRPWLCTGAAEAAGVLCVGCSGGCAAARPGCWGDMALRVGQHQPTLLPRAGANLQGDGAFTPCQGVWLGPGAAVSPELGSE